jgi:hypothetical protein
MMPSEPATADVTWPLEPECLLPEQLEEARFGIRATGERALMLAVLEDAIRCFQEHRRDTRAKPGRLAREAEEWITDESDWPFSFTAVCTAVGLEPEAVRAALLGWKARCRPFSVAERPYRLHLRTRRRPRAASPI